MAKIEIRNCPFCGKKPRVYKNPASVCGPAFVQIGCERCNVTQIGTQYETEKEAADAWNRRAEQ